MRRLLFALVLLLSLPAFAKRRPALKLFPTAGSLLAQNAAADRMGLLRVTDGSMLRDLVASGALVPLPSGPALRSTCKRDRAFLRPEAAAELDALSVRFYSAFKVPLFVSSAVRPIDVQRRLRRHNRAAAPPTGPTASVHPAGIAFDIPIRRLGVQQRRWLMWQLWYEHQAGRAIVEQERRCFHVVAVTNYSTVSDTTTTSFLPQVEVLQADASPEVR